MKLLELVVAWWLEAGRPAQVFRRGLLVAAFACFAVRRQSRFLARIGNGVFPLRQAILGSQNWPANANAASERLNPVVLTFAILFEIIAVACDWAPKPDTAEYKDPNKLIVTS